MTVNRLPSIIKYLQLRNVCNSMDFALSRARRFLRSPRVILGELAALGLVCALGAAVPQQGSATPEELARLHESGPAAAALVRWLALDHLFRSPLFLALAALASASLLVVVVEQWKRLRAQWRQPLSEAHFQSASFRAEFERPALRRGAAGQKAKEIQIWTERRWGLLGSPVFHAGLLLVVLAGALRALFGTEAVVDLFEGETLPPAPSAWAAQFPGLLGQPFCLKHPLTLNAVELGHYGNGELQDLKIQLSLAAPRGPQEARLAVNHDLQTDGGRLFLGGDYGPAMLVEWLSAQGGAKRDACLLSPRGRGNFEGNLAGPNGACAYFRARMSPNRSTPERIEIRVMKDRALVLSGDLEAGQSIRLPAGDRIALQGTPRWVRLRGSYDPSLWLAYAGFALAIAGVALVFMVVKQDWCITVTPQGETERVTVALKPQRFAPLFAERFEAVVRKVQDGSLWPARSQAEDTARLDAKRPFAKAPQMTAALLLLGCCFNGCGPSAKDEAGRLVRHYNEVVAEAYRRGDPRLAEGVVGPKEGRKLVGLIGVRSDLGLTLDSELLSLEITGVEKNKSELRVRTRERWRYRDRKIGSGVQVGQESSDAYEMLYIFRKTEREWVVDEIQFASPPKVGRAQAPWDTLRHQMSNQNLTTPKEAK